MAVDRNTLESEITANEYDKMHNHYTQIIRLPPKNLIRHFNVHEQTTDDICTKSPEVETVLLNHCS